MECPKCGNDYKGVIGVSGHWGKMHSESDKPQWLREKISEKMTGEDNPAYGTSFEHTEETKKKIGEASRERWKDEEYKKRVSESIAESREWNGPSEETKQKISETLTGRKLSEETRNKLKGKTKGKKNGMYGKTGEEHPMGGTTLSEEHKKLIYFGFLQIIFFL